MDTVVQAFRSGSFVTRHRAMIWSLALLFGFATALVFLAATAHGIDDYQGRPLGTDFSNSYAAGKFVLEGKPTAPFDIRQQFAREQAIFGRTTPFFGWHYPPFFLPVAGALAELPYIPALLLWQVSTLVLYLIGIAALLRSGPMPGLVKDRLWIILAIAFPAVFVNLIHGQNGFLTAALLTGGLALLDRRPALAGILFGLLVYKPQFLLVIPLALVASARWRTLVSLVATVLIFAMLVTALFGPAVWPAFISAMHFARTVIMENGGPGFYKFQSIFAWVRLWGGAIPLAYAFQGLASAVAVATIWLFWRRRAGKPDQVAILCIAAPLATPYCYDYDLMILAPAIAALAAQGISRSFRPYETALLTALWLVPMISREIAQIALIPLGVILLLVALLFLSAQGKKGRQQRIGIRSHYNKTSTAPLWLLSSD